MACWLFSGAKSDLHDNWLIRMTSISENNKFRYLTESVSEDDWNILIEMLMSYVCCYCWFKEYDIWLRERRFTTDYWGCLNSCYHGIFTQLFRLYNSYSMSPSWIWSDKITYKVRLGKLCSMKVIGMLWSWLVWHSSNLQNTVESIASAVTVTSYSHFPCRACRFFAETFSKIKIYLFKQECWFCLISPVIQASM